MSDFLWAVVVGFTAGALTALTLRRFGSSPRRLAAVLFTCSVAGAVASVVLIRLGL